MPQRVGRRPTRHRLAQDLRQQPGGRESLPQHPCTRGSLAQKALAPAAHSAPAPPSRNSLSSGEPRDAFPQHQQQALRVPAAGPCLTPAVHTPQGHCLALPTHTPSRQSTARTTSSQYGCVKGMHDLLKTNQETTQKSRP